MDGYTLFYILGSIILIGFFAGMEIAFIAVNRINIELRKKQGTLSGRILGRFVENPAIFVGTSLVGIHLLLVVYGIKMTELNELWIRFLPGAAYVRLFLNILVATLVILFFAELLPQALFRRKSAQVLSFFALPMAFFSQLLYPIASFFVSVSEFILKYLFNVRIREDQVVFSRVDPEAFIRQSLHGHETVSEKINTELFENALELMHVRARKCMIPRNEIIALPVTASVEEVRQLFIDTKLSRIIIYEGSIDVVIGYVYYSDIYNNPASIQEILHPIIAIPETMSAMDLMNLFTKERKSIAWVVDEFGGTAGIITMEDVLEEIFGEIRDEYDDTEYLEQQISSQEYIFSGRLELDYLSEKYGLEFPYDHKQETLSGFIISHFEAIPPQKERIIIGKYEFDILLVTDTRIETVKLKVLKSI
jgi:putative hemolysin